VLPNPRRPRLAVEALLPFVLRDLLVEFGGIGQGLVVPLHHRIDGLTVAPALQHFSRAYRDQLLGWRQAVPIAPLTINASEDRAPDNIILTYC